MLSYGAGDPTEIHGEEGDPAVKGAAAILKEEFLDKDKEGKMNQWWTEEDFAAFLKRNEKSIAERLLRFSVAGDVKRA